MDCIKRIGLVLLAAFWLPLQCVSIEADGAASTEPPAHQASGLLARDVENSGDCRAGRPSFARLRQIFFIGPIIAERKWIDRTSLREELQSCEKIPIPFIQNWCLLRRLGVPVRAPSPAV